MTLAAHPPLQQSHKDALQLVLCLTAVPRSQPHLLPCCLALGNLPTFCHTHSSLCFSILPQATIHQGRRQDSCLRREPMFSCNWWEYCFMGCSGDVQGFYLLKRSTVNSMQDKRVLSSCYMTLAPRVPTCIPCSLPSIVKHKIFPLSGNFPSVSPLSHSLQIGNCSILP